MAQRLMEKVESLPNTEPSGKVDTSIPQHVIADLRPTDQITYSYERRSRLWFDGHIGALKALSAIKTDGASRGNPDGLINMDIPRHGRVVLPFKRPHLNDNPASAVRELVRSIEQLTALRPRRKTEPLSDQLHEFSTQLIDAQKIHRGLQETYNQLIINHEEMELAYRQENLHVGAILNDGAEADQAEDTSGSNHQPGPDGETIEAAAETAGHLSESRAKIQFARIELHTQSLEVTKISAAIGYLERYLHQLEDDNRANPSPIRAVLLLNSRLDTPDNRRYLGEMGYEIKSR